MNKLLFICFLLFPSIGCVKHVKPSYSSSRIEIVHCEDEEVSFFSEIENKWVCGKITEDDCEYPDASCLLRENIKTLR